MNQLANYHFSSLEKNKFPFQYKLPDGSISVIPTKMNAAICKGYGSPEMIEVCEVYPPKPKEDEILVMVLAADVNSADHRVRSLEMNSFIKPLMRLVFGLKKPRNPILGTAFSGIVIQKGKKVQFFHPGDEVFGVTGLKFGAHAEFLVVKEKGCVITKPKHCSFEEAAAIPFGGQTALYFLEKLKITTRNKPKVLIIGSTGSVGTSAIQICQYYQIQPTVVCSSRGLELMKSMGITSIICYDQENYTKISEKFDVIFDAVGKSNKKDCKHLLNPGGDYRTVGGMEMSTDSKGNLYFLKSMVDQGKFRPIIEKVYALDQIVQAHQHISLGRKKGNIVVQFNPKPA